MWFDKAFQIIEEHNAGKDPREIKTKAELELIKRAQSLSGKEQEQNMDEYIQEELEAGYDPLRGRIQNNEKAIEAYLIGQRKLFAGEEHHLGIMVLDTKEGEVYSVTVCVAQEDDHFCEAYL